ncbi:hypothetical protein ABTY98_16245 [Streptomyces sp. NPDC096040]
MSTTPADAGCRAADSNSGQAGPGPMKWPSTTARVSATGQAG